MSLGLLLIHEDFCGFLITHNDTPQSVGLLWTSDSVEHFLLPTNAHNVKKRRVIKTF